MRRLWNFLNLFIFIYYQFKFMSVIILNIYKYTIIWRYVYNKYILNLIIIKLIFYNNYTKIDLNFMVQTYIFNYDHQIRVMKLKSTEQRQKIVVWNEYNTPTLKTPSFKWLSTANSCPTFQRETCYIIIIMKIDSKHMKMIFI